MAVNLLQHKDALVKAYNDVFKPSSSINWAVFGYEGQSTTLKVVETGDGGLEEMVEELNASKIMYAYCRVVDPNTNLPKYVLINWQGQGAPETVKFKCANHLKDITNLFHSVHVTINARSEDDVEPDLIMTKVAKASGANYSFHKEKSKPIEAPLPVGSVYEKTQAHREINPKSRDEFWAKTEIFHCQLQHFSSKIQTNFKPLTFQKEEKRRQEELRLQSERQKEQLEKERKEREVREAEEREKQALEKQKMILQQKQAEKKADEVDRTKIKKQWEQEEAKSFEEEDERRKRAEIAAKERTLEASQLSSKGGVNSARSFFQRKASQSEETPAPPSRDAPPPRKLKHQFGSQSSYESNPTREPLTSTQSDISVPTSPPPTKSYPPRQASPPPSQTQTRSYPPRQASPPPREPSPPQRQSSPPRQPAHDVSGPKMKNLLAQNLPPRAPSDDEEENDEDWEDQAAPTPTAVLTSGYVEEPTEQQGHEPVPEYQVEDNHPNGNIPALGPEYGLCVRALYDYQAGDDTEISFEPDDIITNVEQIDPGWWTGQGPDGKVGMFPANYVEAINQ
ncbi:hypothetical protein CHS0354_004471 [Potamilus streckersoni]|uniref:Coactosin-like protein n=1 Tax=Potamilus streckersoni TaxID=2493646 RepID=A0AAE0VZ99_9BIVA|nr:hypothetical protein CHS0354_004471 [Potamilus streckersoni]